jgi:hypothetical protein
VAELGIAVADWRLRGGVGLFGAAKELRGIYD